MAFLLIIHEETNISEKKVFADYATKCLPRDIYMIGELFKNRELKTLYITDVQDLANATKAVIEDLEPAPLKIWWPFSLWERKDIAPKWRSRYYSFFRADQRGAQNRVPLGSPTRPQKKHENTILPKTQCLQGFRRIIFFKVSKKC